MDDKYEMTSHMNLAIKELTPQHLEEVLEIRDFSLTPKDKVIERAGQLIYLRSNIDNLQNLEQKCSHAQSHYRYVVNCL